MSREHWKHTTLGKACDLALGRTPSRRERRFWQNGKHAWVTVSDMPQFGHIYSTNERVSEEAHQEVFRQQKVPAGTLLMSFKLTIGKTAILDTDAYHNEAIMSIYPKPGIDRDFLMFLLAWTDYSKLQDRAVKGQTLNKGKLQRLPILLPPLPEQQAIAKSLQAVQSATGARQQEAELLDEMFGAILEELMSGRLSAEPLIDEAEAQARGDG